MKLFEISDVVHSDDQKGKSLSVAIPFQTNVISFVFHVHCFCATNLYLFMRKRQSNVKCNNVNVVYSGQAPSFIYLIRNFATCERLYPIVFP